MMNTRPLDELAARIGQVLESSPAKDIEKNIKALLTSGLARLDVVPRAEFDIQAQVLLRTREKLEALERRMAELESRFSPSPVPMGAAPGMGGGVGAMGGPTAGAMPGAGPMGGPAEPGGPGTRSPGA